MVFYSGTSYCTIPDLDNDAADEEERCFRAEFIEKHDYHKVTLFLFTQYPDAFTELMQHIPIFSPMSVPNSGEYSSPKPYFLHCAFEKILSGKSYNCGFFCIFEQYWDVRACN